MRFCKIILSIWLMTAATAAMADNVFGTAERPDPAAEKIAVNTTPSEEYGAKNIDFAKLTDIEVLDNGRLWASVLGGGENEKGFLLLAYSDNKGKSWRMPVGVIDPHDATLKAPRSANHGVLWLSPKGELWYFYTVSMFYFDGRGSLFATVCGNPDSETPTWSDPVHLGAGVCTGKPVVHPGNGNWVLPVALWGRDVINYEGRRWVMSAQKNYKWKSPYADAYKEYDAKRGSGVYVSSDEGATWSEHLGAVITPSAVKHRYPNPTLYLNQKGGITMVTRSANTAYAHASWSTDGVKWSRNAWKLIPAPDQNMLYTNLPDGKLMMVRNGRFDQPLYWHPEKMYVYLSDDNGATWYGGLRVSSDNLSQDPCVTQGKDGKIYIAYTSDIFGKSEIRLVVTTESEIDNASSALVVDAESIATILPTPKASARADAELRALQASRKSWGKESLRVATYNIQYPTRWSERLMPLVKTINKYDFDLFGSQEPFMPQIEDMMKHIGDRYDWIGSCISGDDNTRNRHFNPIFYKKERLELLDWNTIWFTDKAGESGYGAWSARLMTWALFRDKKTDKQFYLFNSHFDHRGPEARLAAAHVLVQAVREVAKGMPAFCTGDFNSDEHSAPYKAIINSQFLNDSFMAVAEPVNGIYPSGSGYKAPKPGNSTHIDHIFFTPNAVRINHWELIIEGFDGMWGSDHLPIFVDCKIAN
ncbi:MAG: exo-alpha-sialidase [Alistipes sp.]|nr:exo-alpha-sialidase [Alistipes sp.]